MYPSYLPKELREDFYRQDLEWLKQAREQRGFFRKMHAVALVSGGDTSLLEEIINGLDKEVRELERNTSTKFNRDIRFIDGAFGKGEGRTGDDPEDVTNAKPQDTGNVQEKAVRYRWEDEPREDIVGDADSP